MAYSHIVSLKFSGGAVVMIMMVMVVVRGDGDGDDDGDGLFVCLFV